MAKVENFREKIDTISDFLEVFGLYLLPESVTWIGEVNDYNLNFCYQMCSLWLIPLERVSKTIITQSIPITDSR